MSALLLATASALALHAGPHTRRSPPRRAAVRCSAPPPPPGEGGGAPPEPTPSDAREALERAVAIDAEVLPPSYFESLRYDEDAVPWDLFGLPQAAVRNAAQSGAFGPRGTAILDCGCVCHRGLEPRASPTHDRSATHTCESRLGQGSGDNANWLAANHGYEMLGFDLSGNAVATATKRGDRPETSSAIAAAGGSVEFVQASVSQSLPHS